MQKKEFSTTIGGKTLTATFTDLAENANGSVMLRYGNTIVLATAVMSENERQGIDYFPLTVDYEEKFYAAGQILGSRFIRREGRPSDEAVLSGRAVDRTIRPLFDGHIRNEVQVVITVLSLEKDDPDVLAVNAASLALATSDIPWGGPVSAVRIGKLKGNSDLVVNPEYEVREHAENEIDMLVGGKDGNITMIEAGAHEPAEAIVVNTLKYASEELEKIQEFQKTIIAEMGREKRIMQKPEMPEDIRALFADVVAPRLSKAVFTGKPGKTGVHELEHE